MGLQKKKNIFKKTFHIFVTNKYDYRQIITMKSHIFKYSIAKYFNAFTAIHDLIV